MYVSCGVGGAEGCTTTVDRPSRRPTHSSCWTKTIVQQRTDPHPHFQHWGSVLPPMQALRYVVHAEPCQTMARAFIGRLSTVHQSLGVLLIVSLYGNKINLTTAAAAVAGHTLRIVERPCLPSPLNGTATSEPKGLLSIRARCCCIGGAYRVLLLLASRDREQGDGHAPAGKHRSSPVPPQPPPFVFFGDRAQTTTTTTTHVMRNDVLR